MVARRVGALVQSKSISSAHQLIVFAALQKNRGLFALAILREVPGPDHEIRVYSVEPLCTRIAERILVSEQLDSNERAILADSCPTKIPWPLPETSEGERNFTLFVALCLSACFVFARLALLTTFILSSKLPR